MVRRCHFFLLAAAVPVPAQRPSKHLERVAELWSLLLPHPRSQGQAQGKGAQRAGGGGFDEGGAASAAPGSAAAGQAHSYGRGSPPVPGSPLTYSPQLAMEPTIVKGGGGGADEFGRGGSVYGQSEFAG